MRENLDNYISNVKSEIDKFNEYFNINYEALTAGGERCGDMMSNLFK